MAIKHHNDHFNISPMNRSHQCLPSIVMPHTNNSINISNYSGMGHELSYDNVLLHTQDFLEMQELLRNSGDVPETSNT